ncbi:protein lin-9 homolog isoform X2 [Halichondria panicea]
MEKGLRTSPRKKTPKHITHSSSPKKSLNHSALSSRKLDFSNDSSGLQNSVSDSSGGEGAENGLMEIDVKPLNRSLTASPSKRSPSKLLRSDQATLLSVSSRFRNLLKLPKAHKWCYYEWFYSDIDQPLLVGENDFCRCLQEMFPDLKTRSLTRVQWHQLRRLMGKPRRCSPTFFAEERTLLEFRRKKIRQLQRQVHQGMIISDNMSQYKDLPDELPALLVVGTKVTARLASAREHKRGFYTGTVDAVDIDKHRYWVTFDRPGLGNHPIPDTEIRSAELTEVISVSSLEASQKTQWPPRDFFQHIQSRTPPRPSLPETSRMSNSFFSPDAKSDPFLTSSPARRKMLNDTTALSQIAPSETQGSSEMSEVEGPQVIFLKQVAELSKLLQLKQEKIKKLGTLNKEVEKLNARQLTVTPDIQRRYAHVVVNLDDVNKQLNARLESIRTHCESLGFSSEVYGSPDLSTMEQAVKITGECNSKLEATGSGVKEPRLVNLVGNLTGLLIQIEKLSKSGSSLDLSSLSTFMGEIEKTVHPQNKKYFQDRVETPITLIQSGMNPGGTLHAFSTRPGHNRTYLRQVPPYS